MPPSDDRQNTPSQPAKRLWWYPTWLSLTLLALFEAGMIYLLVDLERSPVGEHPRLTFWVLLLGIVFPLLAESGNLLAWWRRRNPR
jgi:hypothetical protein